MDGRHDVASHTPALRRAQPHGGSSMGPTAKLRLYTTDTFDQAAEQSGSELHTRASSVFDWERD
jgi:hypothetical protein